MPVHDCSRTAPSPDPLRGGWNASEQSLASVGITGWNGSGSPAAFRWNTQTVLIMADGCFFDGVVPVQLREGKLAVAFGSEEQVQLICPLKSGSLLSGVFC